MTDRGVLALRLIALAELLKRVRAADGLARQDIAADMPVEAREPVRVAGPYGTDIKVGSVTYAKGATYASVTDEAALLQWVRDNRPDEIVETRTEQIRGSFRDWLLSTAKADKQPVDHSTGEPIPGITVREGNPIIKVTQEKSDEAIAALVQLIHSDPFALRSLLELEPPSDES